MGKRMAAVVAIAAVFFASVVSGAAVYPGWNSAEWVAFTSGNWLDLPVGSTMWVKSPNASVSAGDIGVTKGTSGYVKSIVGEDLRIEVLAEAGTFVEYPYLYANAIWKWTQSTGKVFKVVNLSTENMRVLARTGDGQSYVLMLTVTPIVHGTGSLANVYDGGTVAERVAWIYGSIMDIPEGVEETYIRVSAVGGTDSVVYPIELDPSGYYPGAYEEWISFPADGGYLLELAYTYPFGAGMAEHVVDAKTVIVKTTAIVPGVGGEVPGPGTGTQPPATDTTLASWFTWLKDSLVFWLTAPFRLLGSVMQALTGELIKLTDDAGPLMGIIKLSFGWLPDRVTTVMVLGACSAVFLRIVGR